MTNKITKFIVGAVVALAIFGLSAASVNAYSHSVTLKQGSRSNQVAELQKTLNMTSCKVALSGAGSAGFETTYFGPATKAAVQCFQRANPDTGSADGIVGRMTGNKLSLVVASSGNNSGNFPAGCTSAAGYSATTGQPCYSASSFPAGCTSTAGFSPTTGASCAGTTTGTGTNTNNGQLTGTAGNINSVTTLSSVSNVKVGEGASNTQVAGFEIKADAGSDLRIQSVNVSLAQTNAAGSKRLNRYAQTVSVWMDGTKVGSTSVADFSEDSNIYTANISLSNAIVKADQKARFYIGVDAVSNVDSTDLANNSFTATLKSVRYQDASGAILTYSAGNTQTFQFGSLSTVSDLKFSVGLANDNLSSRTVKVSTTANTNNVEVLKFTMKAQGSSMTIDQVPVTITTSGTDLSQVTGNLTLTIGGNTYSESVSVTSASTTIVFDDLNITLSKDQTITGTITADINDIEGALLAEGTTLTASIPSSLVSSTTSPNYFDVEDVNGDQVVTGNRSGSAVGNAVTFRSTGVNVVVSASTTNRTTDSNGAITSVTYNIPVAVTAFGNDLYLGQSAVFATTNTGSSAFAYVFQSSSAPSTDVTTGSSTSSVTSSDATLQNNGYLVNDGTTKHFTVSVTYLTPASGGSNYRVQLKEVQTFLESTLAGPASKSTLSPSEQYQTGYERLDA